MFRLLKKFHLSKGETKKSKFSLFFSVQHVIQDLSNILAQVKLSSAEILLSSKYTLYRVNLIDTGFSRVLVLATLTFGPRTDDRAGIVLVAFKLCSWQMKVLEAAMAQAAFLGEFFKEKQKFWGRKVMFLEKHWSSILGLSITSFMTRKAFNFSKVLFS